MLKRLSVAVLAACAFVPSLTFADTLPVPPVTSQDHILGRPGAPVSIIEYADFECPFCKIFHTTIMQAFAKERSKANLVYRHYPLSFHENAMPAAHASQCVGKLVNERAFWLFSQIVFARGAENYMAAARAAGADPAKLKTCMMDSSIEQSIQSEADAASPTVTGTPTTIIVNHQTNTVITVSGAVPLDQLTSSIEDAIKGTKPPSPTPSVPVIPTPEPSNALPTASGTTLLPVDPKVDHVRGNATARITIVEYADFECPFCKQEQSTLQSIMAAYPTTVNWVFRQYPLSFHENAEQEARASECVAALGGNDAFWKFEDGIFAKTTSNGTGFPLAGLSPLAMSSGVSADAFSTCLASTDAAKKLQRDRNSGDSAGVQGTPMAFIIDNVKGTKKLVDGAYPLSTFTDAIDAMLKQ